METASGSLRQLAATSKHVARRLLAIGENRLELLTVEVQEEGKHLLHAILVALSVATFGLLAGVALTGVVVVVFWDCSPVAALVTLTCLYGAVAFVFYPRLAGMRHDWNTLSATLDQFRKDRACLEKPLE